MMQEKTEKEKMLTGENYISLVPELCKMREETLKATMKFNTTGDNSVIKEIFKQEFENFHLVPPFYCEYGENIKIGKNVFINFNCSILSPALVEIGDNCYIGPNVQLYTAIHPINPIERNKGINLAKPIKIGKDCWIGGGVIVLPGVEIGEGCTIGAGSVVTKNIPSYTIAVGNPARIIRKIEV